MYEGLLLFSGALLIEGLVGEPPAVAHPVVWMGHAIKVLESSLFRGSDVAAFIGGIVTATVVPVSFAAVAHWGLDALRPWPWLFYPAGSFVLSTTFSIRALDSAAKNLRVALVRDPSLESARHRLRSLCSRDPSDLDESDLVAATIESVAENANDSVVAPLFYWVLFGVPGAIVYRAANTLDAMLGYRGRYEYFGKAAARLDDVLGWIPARLSAVFLCVGGWLTGHLGGNGWRVALADHRNTESPNAGWPMAAMAGVLAVGLEKHGHYKLGEARRGLDGDRIDEARSVFRVMAVLAALITLVATWVTHDV